jgi:hypothetical protein
MSSFWRRAFRAQYRILGWLHPLIHAVWRRFGIGNILELHVAGRDGRGERSRLVGLLHAGGRTYLGHPNGHVGWTRDIQAAGGGVLRYPNGTEWPFRATLLPDGGEREQAIGATSQHPFPGNLVYRLGRGHVRAVGVFFRVEPA